MILLPVFEKLNGILVNFLYFLKREDGKSTILVEYGDYYNEK